MVKFSLYVFVPSSLFVTNLKLSLFRNVTSVSMQNVFILCTTITTVKCSTKPFTCVLIDWYLKSKKKNFYLSHIRIRFTHELCQTSLCIRDTLNKISTVLIFSHILIQINKCLQRLLATISIEWKYNKRVKLYSYHPRTNCNTL